jgi:hypothetical protein
MIISQHDAWHLAQRARDKSDLAASFAPIALASSRPVVVRTIAQAVGRSVCCFNDGAF